MSWNGFAIGRSFRMEEKIPILYLNRKLHWDAFACHRVVAILGLLMRTLFGVSTPRGLQGRVAVLFVAISLLARRSGTFWLRFHSLYRPVTSNVDLHMGGKIDRIRFVLVNSFAMGC